MQWKLSPHNLIRAGWGHRRIDGSSTSIGLCDVCVVGPNEYGGTGSEAQDAKRAARRSVQALILLEALPGR